MHQTDPASALCPPLLADAGHGRLHLWVSDEGLYGNVTSYMSLPQVCILLPPPGAGWRNKRWGSHEPSA